MARKLCIVCNTRPGMNAEQRRRNGVGRDFDDQCEACYEYGGWENTHSDDAHDAVADGDTFGDEADMDRIRAEMVNCPVCLGNDPANDTPRTGHTNTRANSHNTHGACKHNRTAKDRAACRKANRFEDGRWVPKA